MKNNVKKLLIKTFILFLVCALTKHFYSAATIITQNRIKFYLLIASPIIIPLTVFYLQALLLHNVEKYTKYQQKLEKQALRDFIETNYESKCKPYALEAKSIFNLLMKTKALKRPQLLELTEIIERELGVYARRYNNYPFTNDAHKVYKLLEDHNLDLSSLNVIISYLESVMPEIKTFTTEQQAN